MTELEAKEQPRSSGAVKALFTSALLVIAAGTLLTLPVTAGCLWQKDDETDVSQDYDIKEYEMGKEAAEYMKQGDAKMEEARNIYNKMDEAETALLEQLMSATRPDLAESIEWIRTLEGKARASLAEAGTYYDKILGMHYVDDYAGYARMQKDLINLYGELFAAQDVLIDGLAGDAYSGQLPVAQLEYITGLTRSIDEAAGLAGEYQLQKGL